MSTPLLLFPRSRIVMPPRYMATAGYYAVMAAYGRVTVDSSLRYDKRAKTVHRCEIADTRGRLSLTVPVSVPHGLEGRMRWDMVRVSRHGEWWRLQRTALESAYGRTPYFEFLIDKFDTMLADPGSPDTAPSVIDLDRMADETIRHIIGLDNDVRWAPATDDDGDDMRRRDFTMAGMPVYRQLRADRIGFVDNLSVLDLIFNLGPESAFYLKELQSRIF